MRKNLLAGLVILLPITITIWIVGFLVDMLTNPFIVHVQNFFLFVTDYNLNLAKHHGLLLFLNRIVILIFLFFFVILLGYLGKKIFFHWIVRTLHILLLKIPLINSIYKGCKDIISALFSEENPIFSRVVTVPFPCKEAQSIGLVAGLAPEEIRRKLPPSPTNQPMKVVFVATSPHPTAGFLLLTHEDHLITLDISLEDVFKFLISCGIFLPEHQKQTP